MWFICHKIVIFLYENDDVLTFAMEKVDVELFSHLTRDFAFQKIKKRHDRTQKYLIIPVISKIFEVWHAFFFLKKEEISSHAMWPNSSATTAFCCKC